MKVFLWITSVLVVLTFAFFSFGLDKKIHIEPDFFAESNSGRVDTTAKIMAAKAKELYEYAKKNGYNTERCLLVNMHLASGKDRLFVYDFKKGSVLLKGLVAHGRCNEDWLEGRRYNNKIGCGCSSLGKYKIGVSYQGRFGLAYKLHGLDSSNSNAFKRYVVLHSHECVPDFEIYPSSICQSDGCPTVSPEMIVKLAKIIDHSEKPMLLYLFDEQ